MRPYYMLLAAAGAVHLAIGSGIALRVLAARRVPEF
jgi:hypothetical protein